MIGADRDTGRRLGGDAHLAQSVIDILTTPVGSRVMRRTYGSEVPDLIDAPLNGETTVAFFAAVAAALDAWEPRLRLERVIVVEAFDGGIEVELRGARTDRALESGIVTGRGLAEGGIR